MAKKKEKVKQHYVPQSYLSRFADQRGQLFVYDKYTRTSYPANIKDVAQGRYFYDFPEQVFIDNNITSTDIQYIENFFSGIEGKFRPAVDQLITNAIAQNLSENLRLEIALYVVLQLFRTREFRNGLIESYVKTAKLITDVAVQANFPDVSPDKYKIVFNEDMASLLHAKQILDKDFLFDCTAILNNHIWLLGVNTSNNPLYTSDNPVVKKAHENSPYLHGGMGLRSFGVEIVFPLTPNHILIMRERHFHKQLEQWDGKAVKLHAENITYLNSLQVIQSDRQVYCSVNDFSFAEKVCNDDPSICDPARDRWHIGSIFSLPPQ